MNAQDVLLIIESIYNRKKKWLHAKHVTISIVILMTGSHYSKIYACLRHNMPYRHKLV